MAPLSSLRDEHLVLRWLAECCGLTEAQARERLEAEEDWPGRSNALDLRERGVPPFVWSRGMERFYRESSAPLFEHVNYNRSALKDSMRAWIARRLGPAPKELLCFGDGIGADSAFLCRLGHRTTYCEVSGPASSFAVRLFAAEGVSPRRATRLEDMAPGSFDAVVCLDVLEHLPDPLTLLRLLAGLLKPGGELLVHAPYGAVMPSLPLHLRAHRWNYGNLAHFREAGLHPAATAFLWMPIALRRERSPSGAALAAAYFSMAVMKLSLVVPFYWHALDWGFHLLNWPAVRLGRALARTQPSSR